MILLENLAVFRHWAADFQMYVITNECLKAEQIFVWYCTLIDQRNQWLSFEYQFNILIIYY